MLFTRMFLSGVTILIRNSSGKDIGDCGNTHSLVMQKDPTLNSTSGCNEGFVAHHVLPRAISPRRKFKASPSSKVTNTFVAPDAFDPLRIASFLECDKNSNQAS